MQYKQWIGSFMWPVFGDPLEFHQQVNSLTRNFCSCTCLCSSRSRNKVDATYSKLTGIIATCPAAPPISSLVQEKIRDDIFAEELMQEMLRDLLYWSIFTDRINMAKVLILHIRPRICAALSCAAILTKQCG